MSAIRSRKYLDGARGSTCKLRIVGCCTGDTETTVAAHIRDRHTGKGIKASDISIVDACWACHDLFDGRSGVLAREDWLFYALRGLQETIEDRIERGLLILPQDAPKAKETKPRKPKEQRSKITSPGFSKQHRPLQSRNNLRKDAR